MKFKPNGDRVVVDYGTADQVTKSGIYIPEVMTQRPFTGKVMAIGKGKLQKDGTFTSLPIEIGDTVIYSMGAHGDIVIDDKKYLILRFSDIIGKVN